MLFNGKQEVPGYDVVCMDFVCHRVVLVGVAGKGMITCHASGKVSSHNKSKQKQDAWSFRVLLEKNKEPKACQDQKGAKKRLPHIIGKIRNQRQSGDIMKSQQDGK